MARIRSIRPSFPRRLQNSSDRVQTDAGRISRRPPSPSEPLDKYRIIEVAQILKGRERNRTPDQTLAGEAPGVAGNEFFPGDSPIVVTPRDGVEGMALRRTERTCICRRAAPRNLTLSRHDSAAIL